MCEVIAHRNCQRCNNPTSTYQSNCISGTSHSYCDSCGYGNTSLPEPNLGAAINSHITNYPAGVMSYSTSGVQITEFLHSFKDVVRAKKELRRDLENGRIAPKGARISTWNDCTKKVEVIFPAEKK
jgi:hypothetical protein